MMSAEPMFDVDFLRVNSSSLLPHPIFTFLGESDADSDSQ